MGNPSESKPSLSWGKKILETVTISFLTPLFEVLTSLFTPMSRDLGDDSSKLFFSFLVGVVVVVSC